MDLYAVNNYTSKIWHAETSTKNTSSESASSPATLFANEEILGPKI
jgi:hypothetical protein